MIRNMLMMLLTLIISFSCGSIVQFNTENDLIQNTIELDDWTIPTPSDDSRILYVSSSGNDDTAVIYGSSDSEVGDNPFEPISEIKAFASYAAAYENTREGYPDWILMKRGDVFYENIGQKHRSGRNENERFVIGAYGSYGLSPTFKTGTDPGFWVSAYGINNVYVLGIDFYAHTRDPESDEYTGVEGNAGIRGSTFKPGDMDNVLFEGCKFRFFNGNGMANLVDNYTDKLLTIVFRRCLFLDSYSDGSGHCQGLSTANVQLTLDECIFDHNGWYSHPSDDDVGPATIFNHNIYIRGSYNTTVKDCIFSRGSSIGTKFTGEGGEGPDGYCHDITLENNLYLDNEIGIGIGGNYRSYGNYRFSNLIIKDNVVTNPGRTRQTDRDLAWGIILEGCMDTQVYNNLVVDQDNEDLETCIVYEVRGCLKNIEIYENISTNYKNAIGFNIGEDDLLSSNEISFHDNILQISGNSTKQLIRSYSSWDLNFSNNTYYTTQDESSLVYTYPDEDITGDGEVNNADATVMDFNTWQTITDADSVLLDNPLESPATEKNVDLYNSVVCEGEASIDAFIEGLRAQDRYSWDEKYTASEYNEWAREGYFFN